MKGGDGIEEEKDLNFKGSLNGKGNGGWVLGFVDGSECWAKAKTCEREKRD